MALMFLLCKADKWGSKKLASSFIIVLLIIIFLVRILTHFFSVDLERSRISDERITRLKEILSLSKQDHFHVYIAHDVHLQVCAIAVASSSVPNTSIPAS